MSRNHTVVAYRGTFSLSLSAYLNSRESARISSNNYSLLNYIESPVTSASTCQAGQRLFTVVNSALLDLSRVKGRIGNAWFEGADRSFPATLKAADSLL